MSKILGVPVKICADYSIYVPKTFWHYYGISTNDQVIREEITNKVIFRCPWPRQLLPSEKLLRVHQGKVHIRPEWLIRHSLSVGDEVWLIGMRDGLVIYPHPVYAQETNV